MAAAYWDRTVGELIPSLLVEESIASGTGRGVGNRLGVISQHAGEYIRHADLLGIPAPQGKQEVICGGSRFPAEMAEFRHSNGVESTT
jgi:hypothetical protein